MTEFELTNTNSKLAPFTLRYRRVERATVERPELIPGYGFLRNAGFAPIRANGGKSLIHSTEFSFGDCVSR